VNDGSTFLVERTLPTRIKIGSGGKRYSVYEDFICRVVGAVRPPRRGVLRCKRRVFGCDAAYSAAAGASPQGVVAARPSDRERRKKRETGLRWFRAGRQAGRFARRCL